MTEHDERDRLASLPRERDPGPHLRRRVVAALHERGALTAGEIEGAASHDVPRPRRSLGLLRAAAAAVIFLAGVALGRALPGNGAAGGASIGTDGLGGVEGALAKALQVQRLGSAYVEAIARVGDAAEGEGTAQGREAAFSAFRGAAEQLALLPGQDEQTRTVLLSIRAMEGVVDSGVDSTAVERWF